MPLSPPSRLSLRRIFLAVSFAGVLLMPIHSATAADAATVHPELWPQGHSPLPPDPALEARVSALLAKMSVEDKVGQMIQADIKSVTPDDVRHYRLGSILAGGNSKPNGQRTATAVQWQQLSDAFYRASMDISGGRLAIPVLFGIDAVHGHNNLVGSTLFPQNVGLGATRDPQLIHAIGEVTARELRASGINWTFAPTLTVPQDGRWGRAYEGYSQNPALVAQYAGAVVAGLEGKLGTPQYLDADHVIATAKHFVGDGGTRDGKDQGDAEISEAMLRDVHAAGYAPAIKAGVQVVMVSFSSWNGVTMAGRDRFPGLPGSTGQAGDPDAAAGIPGSTGPGADEPDSAAAEEEEEERLEIYGDSSYGSGEARAAYRDAGHDTVIKPGPLRPAVPGGFTIDDFTVDEQAGTVTCPAGQVRPMSKTRTVTFGAVCAGCPLRELCTTAKHGRSMTIHPHEDLLRAARAQARTDDFKKAYPTRAAIERIISWTATQNGRRIRLRYLGTAKNNAWLHTRCAAINLRTLLRHGLTRRDGAWTLA